ncbi:MAG: prepilin-type N-terminal cleavage/methylation domain-containing protein [Halanaerobiales bacterium]|nr:prepilin-type N-terminal cleavage/methylation domain-containing protein [Halanaerobiales bacterium]
MRLNKGFTLIEVITVIAVISTLVVVSPTTRSIYKTFETIITVRNIMMDFRWARYRAVDQNINIGIKVYRADDIYKKDSDNKNDYLIYNTDNNKILKKGTFPGYLVIYKNLNEKKIINDYYDRIEFKYNGTALHGTVGFSYGSRIYKIVVSQLGRVRVEK